ncbi:MAG: cupin domain-containing protein [Thermoplasmata archaeon]
MHQSFIVIGGKGVAEIDGKDIEVSSGDAVYVPPNTVHKLHPSADEMIELIWLAWGEGA